MSSFLSAIFFFTVLLLTVSLLCLMNRARIEKGLDLGNKGGLAIIFSIFLGWILLQTSSAVPPILNSTFFLGFFPFGLAALSLSLAAIQKQIVSRFWIILCVTTLSVAFLPSNLLVFQGYLPLVLDRLTTAILWAAFVNAYTTMDKMYGMTFVQTSAMCLAFSLAPYFVFKLHDVRLFTEAFSLYPLYVLAALIGFMTFRKHAPDLSIGKCGAIGIGYLMGLFLIILTANGWVWIILCMPIYYYFEIIYSRINILIHRKNPQPKEFTFFLSKIFRENIGNTRIIPFLFLMLTGISLSNVVFCNPPSLGVFFTIALFLIMLFRLYHWNQKPITYRSMFKDTKDTGVQVFNNGKEFLNDILNVVKKK